MAPVEAKPPVPAPKPEVAAGVESTVDAPVEAETPAKPTMSSAQAADATKVEPAKDSPATVKPASSKDPWWKVLLGGLTNILLLFLSAIATGLGALLIKWVSRKAKLSDAEVLTEFEKLYNAAIEIGVNFAEQQAKKLMDDPDSKGKRIEWAVEKIQETIKDQGLAEKSVDWIRTRIEAKLGEQNRSKSSASPTEPPKAAGSK